MNKCEKYSSITTSAYLTPYRFMIIIISYHHHRHLPSPTIQTLIVSLDILRLVLSCTKLLIWMSIYFQIPLEMISFQWHIHTSNESWDLLCINLRLPEVTYYAIIEIVHLHRKSHDKQYGADHFFHYLLSFVFSRIKKNNFVESCGIHGYFECQWIFRVFLNQNYALNYCKKNPIDNDIDECSLNYFQWDS